MNNIGQRLKMLREKRGMTMAQIADALHVSSNAVVNNWEKENKKISPKFLKAYADYFNVPIDWIKYGDLENYIFNTIYKEPSNVLKNGHTIRGYFQEGEFQEITPEEEDNQYKKAIQKALIMAELWDKERYPTAKEIEQLYNRLSKPVGYKENLIVQENTLGAYADQYRYFVLQHDKINDEIIENLKKYRELLEEAQKQAQKTLKLFNN